MSNKLESMSDYSLIKMYKENKNKNEVLETLYFRYENLIYKKSQKFCKLVGNSWLDDFKQEAFFQLIKCVESVDLDRVQDGWRIIHIYGMRLFNLGKVFSKKIIRNSESEVIPYNSEKNMRTKIRHISSKFHDLEGNLLGSTEYIENFVGENRSYEYRVQNIRNIFKGFIETVDKPWIKEFLSLVHNGVYINQACDMVGVSRQLWYNNRDKIKKKFKEYEENENVFYGYNEYNTY